MFLKKYSLFILIFLFILHSVSADSVLFNVSNSTEASFLNYQTKIDLNSSLPADFNWDNLGKDLYFQYNDGNNIPFWVESWNSSEQEAEIWLKISINPESEIIVKMFYDGESDLSLSNGDEVFIFFDDFEENKIINYSPTGLINADQNLNIPTYDGSGQNVHPSLVYFEEPFNSWKYWMAITPYTDSNEDLENPSIVVSNDGNTWQVPEGLTNPIIPYPGGQEFNSDPTLFYDGNKFILYYREGSNITVNGDKIKYVYSYDGIEWLPKDDTEINPILVLEKAQNQLIAPTIIFKDDIYYMWAVEVDTDNPPSRLVRYSSDDGINWEDVAHPKINNNISGFADNNLHIWHPEIKYIPEFQEYWMITSAYIYDGGVGSSSDTYFARSVDGINWTVYTDYKLLAKKSGSWDSRGIYKSTFLFDETTNKIRVWYSATKTGIPTLWNTGYTEEDYNLVLKRLDSNLVKWHFFNQGAQGATANISSGVIDLQANPDSDSSSNIRSSKNIITNNIVVEVRQKITDYSYVNTSIGNFSTNGDLCYSATNPDNYWNTTLCYGYLFGGWSSKFNLYRVIGNGDKIPLNSPPSVSQQTHIFSKTKYVYTASGITKWYLNDELKTAGSADIEYLNTNKYLLFSQGEYNTGAGGVRTIDYVFVREYSDVDLNITNLGQQISSNVTFNIIDYDQNWINQDVSLNFVVDNNSSLDYNLFYRTDLSDWQTFENELLFNSDGNYQIDYFARDNSLDFNESINTVFVAIDKTAPVINEIDNNNIWFTEDFNISFDVNFDISGKSKAKYKLNESDSWTDFNEDYNILIDVDGNNTIDYWFRDLAGNDTNGTVYGLLDKSSPIINSIDNNNIWFTEDFNISFDVNFDISGKSEAKYKLNESDSWADFTEDYNILIDVDGNNTIDYWFRDLAGNDTNGTVYGLLDKSSPIINSIDNNNIWFTEDFNISFDVNFDVSGKSEAKYKLKLNESESWTDFTEDYNILIDVDGNNTIDYWFRDLAGNDTNGTVYGLLDSITPVIMDQNWTAPVNNYSFSTTTLTLSGTFTTSDVNKEGLSLVSKVLFSINNNDWIETNLDYNSETNLYSWSHIYTHGFSQTTDFNIYLKYQDLAGNDSNMLTRAITYTKPYNPPSSGGRSGGSSFIYVPSGLESTDDDESESNLLTITNKDSNSIYNSVDVSFVLDNVVNSQKDNLDDVISKKNISKEIKIDRIIKTDVSPVFSLEIRNDSLQSYKDLSIIEVIPKEITDHIDNLVFSIEPTNIINPDPIVEWKISELKSGGFFKINYALKEDKNIDYSVFSKWQLPLIFADDFLDYDSNYQDIEPVVEVLQKEVFLDDPNKKTTPIYDIKEKNILSWLGVLSIIILLFFILFNNRPKNKKKGSRK